MTDKKISDLTVGGILADNDLVEFVDVSDTTQAPTGTSKKMTPVAIQDNISSAGFTKDTQVLTKTNTTVYTPSANYNPSTKKYTDDEDAILQTNIDAKADIAGETFTGAVEVPDEAYGVGWDGSTEVPTKNAVYDKIETIGASGRTQLFAGSLSTSQIGMSESYENFDELMIVFYKSGQTKDQTYENVYRTVSDLMPTGTFFRYINMYRDSALVFRLEIQSTNLFKFVSFGGIDVTDTNYVAIYGVNV